MVNQEFQELKRQWGVNSAERANIIEAMRENLRKRNEGNDIYTFNYTSKGTTINISTAEVGGQYGLFAIDGDMNPYNL